MSAKVKMLIELDEKIEMIKDSLSKATKETMPILKSNILRLSNEWSDLLGELSCAENIEYAKASGIIL